MTDRPEGRRFLVRDTVRPRALIPETIVSPEGRADVAGGDVCFAADELEESPSVTLSLLKM